jgi:hypothetical protein
MFRRRAVVPDWSLIARRTALVAMVWIANSIIYFQVENALGLANGYEDRPLLFTLINLACAGAVILIFRRSYKTWERSAAPKADIWPKLALLTGALAFLFVILPVLPVIAWTATEPMPGLMAATAWYFLPKTAEILFQQILIVTLVVGYWQQGLSLRMITVLLALLFGGFHLSLIFNGNDPFYVARYTLAATLFACLMPWLILMVRSGFTFTFAVHWAFYALDKSVTHLVG